LTFDVTNGRIPDVVEQFLTSDNGFGLTIEGPYRRFGGEPSYCRLVGALEDPDWEFRPVQAWDFTWPHDREPTLQEAIEAVMHSRR
jgi:hypothetical protein